jgi:hypothetical protein
VTTVPERPTDEEIARWQRWFAIECNNRAWQIAESEARTPAQTEEMLNAAHAAALYWNSVGTDLNAARAKMLLGHAHGLAGIAPLALRYAKESFDYFSSHESPDWEVAFAHAVMAGAAHAHGDRALHERHYREAARLGEEIADAEDREVFMRCFRQVPRPSVA